MKEFKLIAFTHKNTPLSEVGKFHIAPELRSNILTQLKNQLRLDELMYLSTCNRVEFLFRTNQTVSSEFLTTFFETFNSNWSSFEVERVAKQAIVLESEAAVNHVFRVAASLDSLVVGEREIITQIRNAFEDAVKDKLSGDCIRLLMRKVIESAKDVFTLTSISKNPVSVVSLAYRNLKSLNVDANARFLIVGTGQTNTNMCKYLKKNGFRNFTLFNRSIQSAENLAKMLDVTSYYPLEALENYKGGFDVLLTCTASAGHLIGPELYEKLLINDTDNKIVIDLAIPYDIDPQVYNQFSVTPILVESLRLAAEENLASRYEALHYCEEIIEKHLAEFRSMFRQRKVEIAMQAVPQKMKEINEHAISNVFAREMESLDENSKEVVTRMLSYLEKKYISVPMKMAREILLEHQA